MKRILTLILLLYLLVLPVSIYGQTPISSPSADPEESTPGPKITNIPSKQIEKIQELKERIATKVAQLKLLKKKVIIGTISKLDNPLFTITSMDGSNKIETNEDTVLTSVIDNKVRSIKFSDLKKDQSVIAWGNYIQEGETLTALEVYVKEMPLGLIGKISDVDTKGGTITLRADKTNQSYLFDVEVFTKINVLDKDNKITKLGFSKIKVGSLSFIYAYPQAKQGAAPYTAYRILILPTLTAITPPIPSISVSPTLIPTPLSTKSAMPTKKPTPTIKLDTTPTP